MLHYISVCTVKYLTCNSLVQISRILFFVHIPGINLKRNFVLLIIFNKALVRNNVYAKIAIFLLKISTLSTRVELFNIHFTVLYFAYKLILTRRRMGLCFVQYCEISTVVSDRT